MEAPDSRVERIMAMERKDQLILAARIALLLVPMNEPAVSDAALSLPVDAYARAYGLEHSLPVPQLGGSAGPWLDAMSAVSRLATEGDVAAWQTIVPAAEVAAKKRGVDKLLDGLLDGSGFPEDVDWHNVWHRKDFPAWFEHTVLAVHRDVLPEAMIASNLYLQLSSVQASSNEDATNAGAADPPAPRPRPSLRMLADAPIEEDSDDALGFKAYADTLADLIRHPEIQLPFTLAINGPWGSGKSTLARMVAKRLSRRDPLSGRPRCQVVWFNAWLNDDAKSLSGSFTSFVAKEAGRRRPRWRQIVSPLPRDLWDERTNRIFNKVIVFLPLGAILAFVAMGSNGVEFARATLTFFGIQWPGVSQDMATAAPAASTTVQSAGGALAAWAGLSGILAGAKKLSEMGRSLADYARDPAKAADDGSIAAARNQLATLIRDASGRGQRFVIIVDDVERVQPPRAVEVLDTIHQLLADSHAVIILLGDMASVAASAGIKYGNLADVYDPASGHQDGGKNARLNYGRLYLQKIVQMQFDLPPHNPQKIQELIARLTDENAAAVAAPKSRQKQGLGERLLTAYRRVNARFQEDFSLGVGIALFIGAAYAVAWLWLKWLLGLFVFFAAIGWFLSIAERWRSRKEELRRQANARKLAEEFRDANVTAAQFAEEQLTRIAPYDSDEERIRLEEALRSARISESERLNRAVATAIDLAGVLPRNAKRLVNALRVLISVSDDRNVGVAPEVIGKWVAFREAWPDLARIAYRDARLLQRLEGGGEVPLPELEEEQERIREFLAKGEPIGAHIPALIHLEPREPLAPYQPPAPPPRAEPG